MALGWLLNLGFAGDGTVPDIVTPPEESVRKIGYRKLEKKKFVSDKLFERLVKICVLLKGDLLETANKLVDSSLALSAVTEPNDNFNKQVERLMDILDYKNNRAKIFNDGKPKHTSLVDQVDKLLRNKRESYVTFSIGNKHKTVASYA